MLLRLTTCFILFFYLSGHAQQSLFSTKIAPKYNDIGPYSVQKAFPLDLNNDGTIEILYVHFNGFTVRYQNPQDPTQYLDPVPYSSNTIGLGDYFGIVDINNDGFPDLATISSSGLVWIENTGTAFTDIHQISYEALQTTAYIDHADIDQDGDVDISGFTGWFENIDGVGDSWNYHSFDVGIQDYELVDVNGDSFPDWVTWDLEDESLDVYLNDGTGTWPSPTNIISGLGDIQSRGVTINDFDGDNDIDIIVQAGNAVKLLRNSNGLGQFEVENLYTLPWRHLTSADIDSDGDIDLITYFSDLDITYSLNSGDGDFGLTQHMVSQEGLFNDFRLIGDPIDMDQDGDLDFFINNFSFDFQVAWLENESLPYSLQIIESKTKEAKILIHDLDNDGFEDVLVSNFYDSFGHQGHLYWYRNEDGMGTFYNPKILSFEADYGDLYEGDFDGDGNVDILLQRDEGDLFWYRKSAGLPSFEEKFELDYLYALAFDATGDFDEDGKMDIIAHHSSPSSSSDVVLFSNFSSTGAFSSSVVSNTGSNILNIVVADVNGDQHLDIVCSPESEPIFWLANDGTGTFGDPIVFSGTSSGNYTITSADLDNDGDPDFIIHDLYELFWLENLDNGSSLDVHLLNDELDLDDLHIRTVDLSNDGDIDILAFRSDNELFYFENKNNGSFALTHLGDVNYSSFKDGDIGDLNGDGITDMVTSSSGQGIELYYNFLGIPTIRGKCFFDENENGNLDATEVGLPSFQLETDPNNTFSYTTEDGEFNFFLNSGNFTISPIITEPWEITTSPESYEVSISDTSFANPLLFGLAPTEEIISTDIYVNSDPTRCGFDVDFYIDHLNPGTVVNDGFVLFVLDSAAQFNYASPAPDSISGLWLYWFYEDHYPMQPEQILVNATMPGVDFLGETLHFIASSSIVNEFGVIIFSDGFRYDPVVNCSYDPNDKLIHPDPPGVENFTFLDDTLIYTIRFQNTGTDTAFNIKILDQLDDNLQWNSCHPLASSHPFQLFRSNTGEIEFLFEDILLPDSNINENASHGFVSYRILQKDGLDDFTVIENTAEIYFDFNPPIITNTTQNTIVSFLPQLEINSESVQCFGDSSGVASVIPIGFAPFQYAWSTGDTTSALNNLQAGIYTVTVTDNEGNVNNISTEITEPPQLIITIGSTPAIDNNNDGTATVTPTGGIPPYNYLWSSIPSQSSPLATGLAPGIYFATVTDGSGCATVVEVSVGSIILPQLEINAESVACFGDSSGVVSVTTIGLAPFQYLWSTGDTTSIINNLPAGFYSVTVTDSIGNSNNTFTEITEAPLITLTVESTPALDNNNNGTATVIPSGGVPPYNYLWSSIPSQNTSLSTGLSSGIYFATITDSNGCTAVAEATVGNITSTQELMNDILSIYPNPSNGEIKIQVKLENPKDLTIELRDLYGRVLFKKSETGNAIFSIEQKGISPGLYTVGLFVDGKWFVERVIVLK